MAVNHLFKIFLLTACFYKLVVSQCPVTSLPPGWTAINVQGSNYCYAVANIKVNSVTARDRCSKIFKGFLARFHDVTSLRALAKKIPLNTKRIWIDLIAKSTGDWIWSDGTTVDAAVLNQQFDGDTTAIDNTYCGALKDATDLKFSQWTAELCTANHEYICQAPKLNANLKDCVNSTFRVNNKCYAVTSELLTYPSAVDKCSEQFNGHLAALEDTELAVASANYFNRYQPTLKNARVWLDIIWDEKKQIWQHRDGRKIIYHEENWYGSQKIFSDERSNVVIDQSVDWKWKTRQAAWKAFAVCQVNSKESVIGKAVLPDDVTESTKANSTTNFSTTVAGPLSIGLDFRMFFIIVGAVGIVLIILLIIVCVLCYKKKVCCLQRKKKENYNNGFGTPVSFDFMNPEYGHVSNATDGEPTSATPIVGRPPALPPRVEDETYATILDEPLSPPMFTVDLLHAPVPSSYSTRSLARTTKSKEKVNDDKESTSSLPRGDYSSRISLGIGGSQDSVTSRNRWNMTSFSNPGLNNINETSPRYPSMSTNETLPENQFALQYAELSFGRDDEDDQFDIGGHSSSTHKSRTHQNGNMAGQNYEHGSMTRHKFSQKYPEIARTGNTPPRLGDSDLPNEYENESSPFVISPDSPQFPL